MEEIWLDILGYEGYYQISTLGRVKSLSRLVLCKNHSKRQTKERIKKQKLSTTGYWCIGLHKNGKCKWVNTHRLIGIAFISNPKNKPQINHKNGIKTDNGIENLEWVTCLENNQHAVKTGLINNLIFYKPSPIVLQIQQIIPL